MQSSHSFMRVLTVALSVSGALASAAVAVFPRGARQRLALAAGEADAEEYGWPNPRIRPAQSTRTLQAEEEPFFVSRHGFSRAASAAKSIEPLGHEGCSSGVLLEDGACSTASPDAIGGLLPSALWLSSFCLAVLGFFLFLTGCGGSFSIVQTGSSLSPTITGVSLVSAPAGSANLKLDISGTNFTRESSTSWGTTTLATSYFGATRLRVVVPSRLVATPSTASLTVSTPAGTAAAMVSTTGGASPEVALAAPAITSLGPTSATVGGAAFTLTINGRNFTSAATSSWGGTALATSYVSATKLTAAVPASLIATVGTASVIVTTAGGTSSAATFIINPPKPTITSLTPDSVVQGSAALTLTVNGANFLPGTLATVVKWGSTALATTYVSSTQVTAVLPASQIVSTGTVNISVATAGGTSSGVSFTINPAPPVITTISPGSVTAGSDAFMLSIVGTHFVSTITINWGSTPLATTSMGAAILEATVPASLVAIAGTVSVTVSSAGGTSAPVTFSITQPQAVLTSLSPAVAPSGGAKFTLTISGTNFKSNSQARWETTWLATTRVSDTQLTASVPASLIATAGTASITVYSSGGGGWAANSVFFTIKPSAPALTSLTPSSVTAGGAGFMLTVKGTSFTPAATSMWNATVLDTIYVSPTQLTVAVPASLIVDAGTAGITVTTEEDTSAPATLTIKPSPPSIGGLNPSVVMAGGAAFTLTISGGFFTSDSMVKWGSTALATTYVSATELTAAVPAKLIATVGTAAVTVGTAAGTSDSAVLAINSGIQITTTALPSGTAGNAYSGPINVTGGVPGYSWTVTGLPDNFTYFNTSGSKLTITGTPASSGTITFQVSAADTLGNSTGPVSYTVKVGAGPNGVNNGKLNGSYVCLLQGFADDNGSRWASLYSFQADGAGNFTGGILDTNSHDVGSASGIMSGSYSIGADNNGVASIYTFLTEGAAGIQTTPWLIALAATAEPAQQFRMVEDDDLGTLPSGQQGTANCLLATPSAFAASAVSGKSFALGLEGEDNSGNPKASVGLFSLSGDNLVTGVIDTAEGGSATAQTLLFTGSYTAPNVTTGRFTVALNNAGSTTGFTVYMIDANRMFILDNTSDDGEQAGNLRTQQQTSYSGANLSGPSVLYTRGAEFATSSTTPSGFYAHVLEQTGNGDGNLTVNQSYANDNGSYTAGSAKGEALALTFDSTYPGRVTFPSDSGTTYLYLFDANSGFAMNVNAAGSLDSGWLEPQAKAAVSLAAIAGNDLYGELPQLDVNSNGTVGEFDLTASGAITGAMSTAGQESSSWDRSISLTYSVDATASGTGTSLIANGTQSQASCAILSAAKLVCVSQTDSAPTIEVIEQN